MPSQWMLYTLIKTFFLFTEHGVLTEPLCSFWRLRKSKKFSSINKNFTFELTTKLWLSNWKRLSGSFNFPPCIVLISLRIFPGACLVTSRAILSLVMRRGFSPGNIPANNTGITLSMTLIAFWVVFDPSWVKKKSKKTKKQLHSWRYENDILIIVLEYDW